MAGSSKKSIADVLRPPMQLELSPTCGLILRDRNRISKENALTVGLRLVYHIIIVK